MEAAEEEEEGEDEAGEQGGAPGPGDPAAGPLAAELAAGADMEAGAVEAEAMSRTSATTICMPFRPSSTVRTQTNGIGRTRPGTRKARPQETSRGRRPGRSSTDSP